MDEVAVHRAQEVGADFGSEPVSNWADHCTARLLWARRHSFASGENLFSAEVPVYALWMVLDGEVIIEWPGSQWRVEAGQAFWGVPCHGRRVSTQSGARWLSAGLRVQSPQGSDALQHFPAGAFAVAEAARFQLEGLLSFLVDASRWKTPGGALARDGATRALAGWIFEHRGASEGAFDSGKQVEWVRQTLERIEREPGVSVNELAQGAHFSPAQFRRLFARHVATSPRDYLHRRRLEGARRLLETEGFSVAEVAVRTGWNTPAQLSREFKRHYGTSPLEWRRAVREAL